LRHGKIVHRYVNLVKRKGKDYDNIEEIGNQYKEFWRLVKENPNEKIEPLSKEMDDLWHEHILDTKLYASDCKRILGFFMHHAPSDEFCHDCWNACGSRKEEEETV
jgi:hypothetical protein